MEEVKTNSIEEKKKNALLEFIWKFKVPVLFLVIIGGGLLYFYFKIAAIESSHKEDIESTVKNYVMKIDSLHISNAEQKVKVFSWAVRSELIRNNIEQVNQFFQAFIKEKDIEKINLINPETALVILSTDMKEEGTTFSEIAIENIGKTITKIDSSGISIVSPIMGLEKKIGVLSVKIKREMY